MILKTKNTYHLSLGGHIGSWLLCQSFPPHSTKDQLNEKPYPSEEGDNSLDNSIGITAVFSKANGTQATETCAKAFTRIKHQENLH